SPAPFTGSPSPSIPSSPVAPRPQRTWPVAMAVVFSLWLAGCSTVPTSSTSTEASTATPVTSGTPPQPLAPVVYGAPLSEIGVAVGETPPVLALAAPADIWDRIRRGFALNDLQNPLVNDREQWYASRPDYIFRMTDRSRKYLFHIVEEIE